MKAGDDKNTSSQGSGYPFMPAPRASRLVQMFTGGGSRRSRTLVLPTQASSSSPAAGAASSTPMTPSPSTKINSPTPLQLSVLIAMPSASRPHHRPTPTHNSSSSISPGGNLKGKEKDASHTDGWHGLEEGEIPHIEFGVLELPYRRDERSEDS